MRTVVLQQVLLEVPRQLVAQRAPLRSSVASAKLHRQPQAIMLAVLRSSLCADRKVVLLQASGHHSGSQQPHHRARLVTVGLKAVLDELVQAAGLLQAAEGA